MARQVLLIGLGRFGMSILEELLKHNCQILVIDKDEERVKDVMQMWKRYEKGKATLSVIKADVTAEGALDDIRVKDFDAIVIAIGRDIQSSILTALTLMEKGAKNIICKAVDERQKEVLKKLGVQRIVLPEKEMGQRIARSIVEPGIEEIFTEPEYGIYSVKVPKVYAGKKLSEIPLTKEYNLIVLMIKRNGEKIMPPHAEDVIYENDTLILFGHYKNVEKFKKAR